MKHQKLNLAPLLILLFFLFFAQALHAQIKGVSHFLPDVEYRVEKNDRASYIGFIIEDDENRVVVKTENLGNVAIPKHEIRSIYPTKDQSNKKSPFAGKSHYFFRNQLSPSARPVGAGNIDFGASIFGANLSVGLTDKISISGASTWIGAPLAISVKYSAKLSDRLYAAGGFLGGSLGIAGPTSYFYGGYASVTYGTNEYNITGSAGYGAGTSRGSFGNDLNGLRVWMAGSSFTLKISDQIAFIGDFLMTQPNDCDDPFDVSCRSNDFVGAYLAGFRIYTEKGSAFQLGLQGGFVSSDGVPLIVPMLSFISRRSKVFK